MSTWSETVAVTGDAREEVVKHVMLIVPHSFEQSVVGVLGKLLNRNVFHSALKASTYSTVNSPLYGVEVAAGTTLPVASTLKSYGAILDQRLMFDEHVAAVAKS